MLFVLEQECISQQLDEELRGQCFQLHKRLYFTQRNWSCGSLWSFVWKWFACYECSREWGVPFDDFCKYHDVRFPKWFKEVDFFEFTIIICEWCFFNFQRLFNDKENLWSCHQWFRLILVNLCWKLSSCNMCFNGMCTHLSYLPYFRLTIRVGFWICFWYLWSANVIKSEQFHLNFMFHLDFRIW